MTAVGEELGGRYRLDAVLGAGGMATVYRAWDNRLDRSVAVKVLEPHLAVDETTAQRFEQEARFLAALNHPSIVNVYDVGSSEDRPFFVMELVEGESLAERLARDGPLAPDEAVPIVSAVAEGLELLHRGGFLHRDVKPHNILLPRTGAADGARAKLTDFGVARGETGSDLTDPGSTVGTLAYLAPELLRGERATPAADVYALGAVAYEALVGRLPFPADTVVGLVTAQAEPPPPPSVEAPPLGTAFDEPLRAALGPAPARPVPLAFASALRDAADRWRETHATPVSATAPTAPAVLLPDEERALRARAAPGATDGGDARRARRVLPIWLLAALGVLVALAALLALQGNTPSPAARGGASAGATARQPTAAPTQRPPPATPAPATPAPRGVSAAERALAAVRAFEQAVAAAQGGRGGLKGKDARELRDLAGRVGQAVRAEDVEAAADQADELVERVEKLSESDLQGDAASAVRAAARRVQTAVAALGEPD